MAVWSLRANIWLPGVTWRIWWWGVQGQERKNGSGDLKSAVGVGGGERRTGMYTTCEHVSNG